MNGYWIDWKPIAMVSETTFYRRKRMGWSDEEAAMTKPIKRENEWDAWKNEAVVAKNTFLYRKSKGWRSKEAALLPPRNKGGRKKKNENE